MKEVIRRALRLIRSLAWFGVVRNWRIARIFGTRKVPFRLVGPAGRTLRLLESDVKITVNNAAFLAGSWQYLLTLVKVAGARWSNSGATALMADLSGITLVISTIEEAIILKEIFVDKIYSMTAKGPAHVIDIGVNVGTATLFFASQPWVNSVTGFEPLEPTFQLAVEHLKMNSRLCNKIKLFNYGLANSDRQIEVTYSPTWKGSIGMYSSPQFVLDAPDQRTALIQVRSASTLMRQVLAEHRGEAVIVKMDCEGAEYEILAALDDSKTLKQVTGFMIEWHDRGAEPLASVLRENGFVVWTTRTDMDRDLGILYAANVENEI